jgi:UDP-glucose 4-epimerase
LTGSQSEIVNVPYRNVFGENFEETRRRVPDIRRAAEILGFRATTPLEEGLQKTIAWFREAWPRERMASGRDNVAGFFDPSGQS